MSRDAALPEDAAAARRAMMGVVCQCGQVRTFTLGEFGATIESCGCGFRRVLRGRSLAEIAALEAQYEATIAEEFKTTAKTRPCLSPAGTEGCAGRTSSQNARYCVPCAEERIRVRNRTYDRTRRPGGQAA